MSGNWVQKGPVEDVHENWLGPKANVMSIAFENPSNAYPTRILYRRDGDALVARIEGKRQGNDASEEWRFTRAP